jgi:hypothetical protein
MKNTRETISARPDVFETQCESGFRIGGVSVQLSGEEPGAVTLVPSLRAFRSQSALPDITIRVERVGRLQSAAGRQLFDSGALWQLYGSEAGFQFDFRAEIFGDQPYKRLFVDRAFSAAVLQFSGEVASAFPEASPLDYPVDELLIMHRLTQEKAIELHSCGIVQTDGTGNLFVGHSGAGKSTTTRLWTAFEEVEVLSDDRIIVRQEAGDPAHMRIYGTPWHGDAEYASPTSAPLARIFILEHGRGNVLTPLSSSQAVAELFARSFVPFHCHEYVESALEFLQEVVDAVPCYRYAFEPNQSAVERILELRD